MAERSRRVKRQISDVTEDSSDGSQSESEEDWGLRISGPSRHSARYDSSASATLPISRPKRVAASGTANNASSAIIQRSTSGSADDRRQSIRLTVKVPPSRLREMTRQNEVTALQDVLGGGKVLDGPRSRRAVNTRKTEKPRYTEYGESDIEDEEEEDEDGEEEDDDENQDEDEDERDEDIELRNNFDEIGAEAEGGTDEDEEMEDALPPKQRAAPRPPKITLKAPSNPKSYNPSKPRVVVTPANIGAVKSVEDQEMDDDPGNEGDSSELSDDEEEEDEEDEEDEEEEEEGVANGEDEEADEEMDEEDAEGDEDDMEDDMDGDSSDETPASGMATPDLAKLTKRQRGAVDETSLMALDMAPQQRKFFTDQEKAMKKDEHARKRKELTKRKIQEEKAAALNRLLKPQASKARGAAPKPETLAAAAAAGPQADEEEYYYEKPNPFYTRWVSNQAGIRLGVPEEWLGKQVGNHFGPPLPASNGNLIQELD